MCTPTMCLHHLKDFTSFDEKFLQSLGRWSQKMLLAVERRIPQKDKLSIQEYRVTLPGLLEESQGNSLVEWSDKQFSLYILIQIPTSSPYS